MATYKRIDGDYSITTLNSADNVHITTHTVKVHGNLDVLGNITYIESTDLLVDDPFITVAANNSGSGSGASFPNQGLVAQTGGNSFAGLRFHNDTGEWQISASVDANGAPITAYQPIGIATAGLPGGPINSIQYNAGSGVFGGNSEFSYSAANSTVTLDQTLLDLVDANIQVDGSLILANIATAPVSPVANSVQVYHNQAGSGGTGVYFQDSSTSDELVSKSKAIVFSIIF
jgi:hypothetical protein